ncbi:MAG TPA: pantoate--beta-alanine ligase [Acidimicrobiales bacterium]|nr:pantoate--beta-alanine ligase [Acidimicrobiales bacterium]
MLTQIDTVDGFRKALDAERLAGRTVGLVPTMGALHAGHAALMERAAAECDVAAVTIFVNPLQFAPTEDLAAYPRDLDGDRRAAAGAGAQLLFTPSETEMYPGGRDAVTTVSVPGLGTHLEGRTRPTHFDGVATVVAKLFAIAGPCRAYFGEKDFQQLAVIRRLVSDLSIPVEVIACPTVRDDDGLALSSRNAYLTAAERAVAPVLHRALRAGIAAIEAGERDAAAVRTVMSAIVGAEPLATLDYAEVVDAHDLTVPARLAGELRLLIAARLGRARLIDNMGVTV